MRLSTFVCCALVLGEQLTAVLASCPARAWVEATTVPILILEAFEGHTQNYYLYMNKCECKQFTVVIYFTLSLSPVGNGNCGLLLILVTP